MDIALVANRVRKRIPRPLREWALRLSRNLLDRWDTLRAPGDDPAPPRHRSLIGGGDFRAIGAEFLGHFRTLGGLKPADRVLDVGCGIGRMAIPLTHYLNEQGSYEGFDIVPEGIEWCQAHITARHPNFRFRLADLGNPAYHAGGRGRAASYRFPYGDGAFDFAFLTSVLTHLMPDEVRRYLSECARVLRPGGTLFATFFLLNDESLAGIEQERSRSDFPHDLGECRVTYLDSPSEEVAYEEGFVRRLLKEQGLALVEPIRYGSWSGRREFLSFQDIVIATRVGTR
jgi:SAM-dependent methyltransferase